MTELPQTGFDAAVSTQTSHATAKRPAGDAHVLVAIASTGRPCLARTLASLHEIDRPSGVQMAVVIADDSTDGAARRIVEATTWTFPVQTLTVASGNISIARNACLDAAVQSTDCTHLAFLDDDEWVARDWLVRLFDCMDEYDADCVFGPVHPVYPEKTPAWLVQANPLYTDWGRRGRQVRIGRTGNTLIRRAAISPGGAQFDPGLGKTGGEDTAFFHQLGLSGARMFVTDDAHVYEEVPPERLTRTYLKRRSLRKGQSYARFRLAEPGIDGRMRFLARTVLLADAALKTAIAILLSAALRPIDRPMSFRWVIKSWLNAGKLREVIGLPLVQIY